jgi:hypothetical protein
MPQSPLKVTIAQAERMFFLDIIDAPPRVSLTGEVKDEPRSSVVESEPMPLAAAPDAPTVPEPPAPKPAPVPPSPPPQPAPPTPPPTTAVSSVRDAVIARRRPRKVSALALTPPPGPSPVVRPTRH